MATEQKPTLRKYPASEAADRLITAGRCGTEAPFDPDSCGHSHGGFPTCGEIVDTAWNAEGAEPVFCEHIDRGIVTEMERLLGELTE